MNKYLIVSITSNKDCHELCELELPKVVDKSVIRRLVNHVEHRLMCMYGFYELNSLYYGV